MRTETLKAVHVASNSDGDEYYEVERNGVTEIKWSEVNGHMSMIDTVQVFKGGVLHSEHTFTQCLSVYFSDLT